MMEKKINILVAEDDKEVANTLFEHLTEANYYTTLSLNGQEALDQLMEKKFDIVILDLKMPIISGYTIMKYIQQMHLLTKVIVLSAYTDINTIEECKKLGATHVLGKPFDLELLFGTIDLITMS